MQNCTSYLACNFATSWRIWPKLCTIVKLIPGQYTFKGLVNRASGKKVIAPQSFEFFSVDKGGPLWVKFAVEFYRVLWTILGAPGAPISGLSSPNVFTPFAHFPIFDLWPFSSKPPTITLLSVTALCAKNTFPLFLNANMLKFWEWWQPVFLPHRWKKKVFSAKNALQTTASTLVVRRSGFEGRKLESEQMA